MAKSQMQAEEQIIFQSEQGPRAFRNGFKDWKIFSVLDGPNPDIARAELLGGANGLVLKSRDSVEALRELPLHTFSIRNEAGDDAAQALLALVAKQPIDPARLDICLGISDPSLAPSGYSGPFADLSSTTEDLSEILRAALLWQTSSAISVRLNAHPHLFETLAKFRAIRILWQRAFPKIELNLHAEVVHPNGSTAPHYMQRCVSACMGAGLGGADSIAILPYDSASEFERRMARNVQNLLKNEAHLNEVADAAAGAGYVEKLTRQFCDSAWERYQS